MRKKKQILKNGWDLPEGQKPPTAGRRRYRQRCYELLCSEEYIEKERAYYEQLKYGSAEPNTDRIPAAEAVTAEKEPGGVAGQGESPAEEEKNRYTPEEKDIYAEAGAYYSGRIRRRRLAVRTVCLVILVSAAVIAIRLRYGPAILMADISSYRDQKIEIQGLTDQTFTVTPGELARMKKTEVSYEVPGEDAEPAEAIGPTLDTFVKKYGHSLDEFRIVKCYTKKDTSYAYVNTLEKNTLILSVADGDQALDEEEPPLTVAVTGKQNTGIWTKGVVKIVFTKRS